jgi:hypothetical protein
MGMICHYDVVVNDRFVLSVKDSSTLEKMISFMEVLTYKVIISEWIVNEKKIRVVWITPGNLADGTLSLIEDDLAGALLIARTVQNEREMDKAESEHKASGGLCGAGCEGC